MEAVRSIFRKKIRNLSIRKTIILYMFLTLTLSYLLGYVVIHKAERTQLKIWEKYMGESYFRQLEELKVTKSISGAWEETMGSPPQEEPPQSLPEVHRINPMEMSSRDRILSEMCDFLQTYSILVISCIGTVFAVFLFYRNKLKMPLTQLTEASAAIADNNLEFTISYSNADEMGQLCREFETMRRQLAENNSRMWKMIEQEKALRASVAHDIRSPLAVLKGYQEMMLEFVPGGALEPEKEMEMLEEGQKQIQRMEDFLDRMKSLSSLEEREIRRQEVSLPGLAEQYRKNLEILAEGSGKKCELWLKEGKETAKIDVDIVTEVMENLLTNALRYARETVTVLLEADNGEFHIEVQDDGRGFTESEETLTSIYYHANAEETLTSIYYHANAEDDLTHFGMGLYLCRIYCEKHGGQLLLGNHKETGGKVVAIFAEEDGKDRAG